ncbi:pitrilysin family protein [Chitinimonas sp. BJYL2]|uniref:M16 family metallopeptidase n=1 Tax=Chitinimonas sp. BJYL2 TaxID=2976696 RepID=UPI0022B43C8B|nr:pitrilysin family protein [Chitinimonas sp. BJYL2]
MRFTTLSLVLATSLGFALPLHAAESAVQDPRPAQLLAGAKASKFTAVEGITEYRLANGLRVLLFPDASKPTTTVNVTYMVGSRHENYGETGMAHLLEHLVFKGTPSLPGKTIVEEFAKRGMRFNGTTFYDRTNYFETFAASDDNLDWALKMEADRMVNSYIAKSDLESEFTVVRNEMESGENNPGRNLWERMTATAYQWHNYGKSTIGARTDVENVKIENLQAFYRTYYQPDNATLIVTGKFDEAKTLARIEQYFGAIPKATRALPQLYTKDPVQDGAREVSVVRVGDTQLIGAIYHIAPGAHVDAAHAELLAFILGDTPTGRLHKALVEKKKVAGIEAESMGLHDPGYILFFANLNKSQSRDEAKKAMLQVIEGVKKQPITEEELKRAKTAILNNFEKTLSDPVAAGISLSESVANGDWRLFFLTRDRIESATVADVQKVAENYLIENNRTFGQFIPADKPVRANMPAAPELGKLLADYKGKAAVAAGEAFDPSPANIDKRTVRLTLANGAKVALLPKVTRGNTVNGQIVLRMGDENSLFGKRETAQLVAGMLTRGAGKLNRQQISDRLDELKAKLSVGTADGNTVSVSFETKRDKLAETLALIRDVLRAPTFPEAELEQFRTEWVTGVEERRRQPDAIAQNELTRHDNPYKKGDVRYAGTFEEQIAAVKAVKLADLKAFHQQFYGAGNAQVSLVGDFDQKAVEAQLKTVLGDWNSKAKYARVANPFRASKAATLSFETPDKANAFYISGIALPVKDDAPEAQALQVANRVLGGGGLKSRIADRLRQKDGISYGAGSFMQLSSYESTGALGMFAIYAPQNLAKLKQGVSEEVARLIKDGITEQELADAKSGILQGLLISRTQDGSLASALATQLNLGRTMQFVADNEAKLKAVTVADVNAVIQKYLDPSKLVQVYAGDFANAAKKAEAAAAQAK